MLTLLAVAGLLIGSEVLRRLVPPLQGLGIPASIIAGCFGLILGPDIVGLLPFDRSVLEALVYHGLALVFIGVALQTPKTSGGAVGAGARSFAFGIPFMLSLQTAVGLAIVLTLGMVLGEGLHPGLGLLLPLGFEQGPGQALSLGAAWEAFGLEDGAQVGLLFAAAGYAWSVLIGVPLVIWGRRKNLVTVYDDEAGADRADGSAEPSLPPGSLDLLTRQALLIGFCYLITYAVCVGLAAALASMPEMAGVVWGFHFMIGAGVAMAVRFVASKLSNESPMHDRTLSRISGLSVDVMTVAALAAVQVAVLKANWLPIALITSVGGLVTLLSCLWLTTRAFPDAPFEHCVVWFGMSTGTLPMGLALLRIIDPDLQSPAPISAVIGSAGAVLGSVPILLFLIPMTATTWPDQHPMGSWIALGVCVVYVVLMLGLWRLLASLRFRGPLGRLWLGSEEQNLKEVAG